MQPVRGDTWDVANEQIGEAIGTTEAQGYTPNGRTGVVHSVVTGGKLYQPVGGISVGNAEANLDTPLPLEVITELKRGALPEPFEVELLSDVEGFSQATPDGDSENDRWMRNIWAPPNRAVVMSYFSVGFAMRFMITPMSYYMVSVLDATPAQQSVLMTLMHLPWSFKLVYGFVSDNFPIKGMRRKPYFVAGWTVYVLMNMILAASEQPSIQSLAVCSLLSAMGFMMSDVATDAILVERSKHEPSETRGSMQAIGYSVRFVGSVLGGAMGMLLYNEDTWGWGLSIQQLFFMNGIIPLLLTGPWVQQLRETALANSAQVPVMTRLRVQCKEVFGALEQRAVYGPMSIVFIYNVFQVPNVAWRSFLVDGLHFPSYQLGILSVLGSLFASFGLLVYKRFFFRSSWRKLYVWTTLVVAFFSASQILLILRINLKLGMSDLLFSIGDDSIADLVSSIQFLPIVQMYISMCPDGAEGTTYAILTTMANVSGAAALNVGTLLTRIWDVSNDAFSGGNFEGMWKLTLLTSLLQPLPLILIHYLPSSVAEQQALQACGIRDRWGGFALLGLLFISLLWTVLLAIDELTD